MTSWVPNSRPIGCTRMTFGRTVKKALKRLPDMWPNLPFDRPDNWDSLSDAAQEALLKAHGVKKRTHDVEMQTHWMTIAQDREAGKRSFVDQSQSAHHGHAPHAHGDHEPNNSSTIITTNLNLNHNSQWFSSNNNNNISRSVISTTSTAKSSIVTSTTNSERKPFSRIWTPAWSPTLDRPIAAEQKETRRVHNKKLAVCNRSCTGELRAEPRAFSSGRHTRKSPGEPSNQA